MEEADKNLSEAAIEGASELSQAISNEAALRTDILARAEAEGLLVDYPDFDVDAVLGDPELGAILRGEREPALRRLYEAMRLDRIAEARAAVMTEARLAEAVSAAVTEAVATAVAESEERLLANIRARGQRPSENGTTASAGIRMHPAVERLTRRERAMLAERAERGETVRL